MISTISRNRPGGKIGHLGIPLPYIAVYVSVDDSVRSAHAHLLSTVSLTSNKGVNSFRDLVIAVLKMP